MNNQSHLTAQRPPAAASVRFLSSGNLRQVGSMRSAMIGSDPSQGGHNSGMMKAMQESLDKVFGISPDISH